MKKYIFILAVFYSTIGISQNDIGWNNKNFIRVEVDMGGFHAIRLFNEGLLLKSINSKSKLKVHFFHTSEINYKALTKLQIYLSGNPDVLKDTIIDDPKQRIFSDYEIELSLTKGNEAFNILWIDGDNEKIKIILKLVNDLIPIKYQKEYYILPSWLKD